jgi:predicted alpha/beta superfamily hydrolase
MKPNARYIIALLLLAMKFCLMEVNAQQPHTLTGDIKHHQGFHSKVLNNDRDVIVYLPPGYSANPKRRYPVLYLHDGQNLFDGATSFIPGKEWRIDESAQQLIESGEVQPLIIVGVNNTGKDRINEYTPVADAKYKMGGGADLYGRMLVEELKPFIDSQYRTRHEPKNTGLGGSSLGGLVSLYLGLKYPKVFGRLAVVSPSVWFADKQLLKFVEGLESKPPTKIWVDMGMKEGRDDAEAQRSIDDARLLRDTLVKKGWRIDRDLKYFEAAGAEHNESAWADRVAPILRFLFPRKM